MHVRRKHRRWKTPSPISQGSDQSVFYGQKDSRWDRGRRTVTRQLEPAAFLLPHGNHNPFQSRTALNSLPLRKERISQPGFRPRPAHTSQCLLPSPRASSRPGPDCLLTARMVDSPGGLLRGCSMAALAAPVPAATEVSRAVELLPRQPSVVSQSFGERCGSLPAGEGVLDVWKSDMES